MRTTNTSSTSNRVVLVGLSSRITDDLFGGDIDLRDFRLDDAQLMHPGKNITKENLKQAEDANLVVVSIVRNTDERPAYVGRYGKLDYLLKHLSDEGFFKKKRRVVFVMGNDRKQPKEDEMHSSGNTKKQQVSTWDHIPKAQKDEFQRWYEEISGDNRAIGDFGFISFIDEPTKFQKNILDRLAKNLDITNTSDTEHVPNTKALLSPQETQYHYTTSRIDLTNSDSLKNHLLAPLEEEAKDLEGEVKKCLRSSNPTGALQSLLHTLVHDDNSEVTNKSVLEYNRNYRNFRVKKSDDSDQGIKEAEGREHGSARYVKFWFGETMYSMEVPNYKTMPDSQPEPEHVNSIDEQKQYPTSGTALTAASSNSNDTHIFNKDSKEKLLKVLQDCTIDRGLAKKRSLIDNLLTREISMFTSANKDVGDALDKLITKANEISIETENKTTIEQFFNTNREDLNTVFGSQLGARRRIRSHVRKHDDLKKNTFISMFYNVDSFQKVIIRASETGSRLNDAEHTEVPPATGHIPITPQQDPAHNNIPAQILARILLYCDGNPTPNTKEYTELKNIEARIIALRKSFEVVMPQDLQERILKDEKIFTVHTGCCTKTSMQLSPGLAKAIKEETRVHLEKYHSYEGAQYIILQRDSRLTKKTSANRNRWGLRFFHRNPHPPTLKFTYEDVQGALRSLEYAKEISNRQDDKEFIKGIESEMINFLLSEDCRISDSAKKLLDNRSEHVQQAAAAPLEIN